MSNYYHFYFLSHVTDCITSVHGVNYYFYIKFKIQISFIFHLFVFH